VKRDDGYLIIADMPGLREEDIDVRIEGSRLVIEGRGANRYYKSIQLPVDASPHILEKKYVNGVLTLKIGRRKVDYKLL
jgi:HSP20 family molecular chaperone IbpA